MKPMSDGKRAGRMNDLIKRRFGRLTVMKQCGVYVSPCGSKRKKWLCKCDCGNEVIVTTNRLTSGNTKSCGCYKSEVEKEVHTKHGGAKHEACERLYNVWKAMKRRCLNPSHKDYKYYGGTGITICDEWLNDYNAFREWAYSNGYDEKAEPMKCTLDRIDPWGKYEPTNCRWVDMYVQNEDSHKRRFLCT